MKECHNCGCQTDSPYCPQCGQRSGEARLSPRALWNDFMSTLLGDGFDSEDGIAKRYGLLGTVWQLVRHPLRTITAYLDGHRRRYFNPLTLLILVSTLCALLNAMFGVSYFPDSQIEKIPLAEQVHASLATALSFGNSHMALFILCEIPLTALAFKWVFRPRKLRYIEFLYIGIFIAVIALFVQVITSQLTHGLSISVILAINAIPGFCIQAALFRRIFGRGIVRTTVNLLLGMGITYALTIVVAVIVVIPFAFLYALTTSA